MDNERKIVLGFVFPNFYKNENAKKKIENFFDEFDDTILSKFCRDVQGKFGASEELMYQSETDEFDFHLEYDCAANYLSMKIYYKDSPNIIEKRLSTFSQLVQKTVIEEYDYYPSLITRDVTETSRGVQAGVVIEEYGKDLGVYNVQKQDGNNLTEIKVSNSLKQCCYSVNENNEYVYVRNKYLGGDANFEGVDYRNCGYVEQRTENFDNTYSFARGIQKSCTMKRNLFELIDDKTHKDMYSEIFDLDCLEKSNFEIMCHSAATFGKAEKSRYFVRKFNAQLNGEKGLSSLNKNMREISKEKYDLIQDDSKYAEEVVNLIQENKEGKSL